MLPLATSPAPEVGVTCPEARSKVSTDIVDSPAGSRGREMSEHSRSGSVPTTRPSASSSWRWGTQSSTVVERISSRLRSSASSSARRLPESGWVCRTPGGSVTSTSRTVPSIIRAER